MTDNYKRGRLFLEAEDLSGARDAFSAGAKEGDPKCLYGLVAVAATEGEDTDRPVAALKKALPALIRLADRGDGDACFMLGRCYEGGAGVAPDVDLALSYYEKAAKLGSTDAMFNLGCFYLHTNTPDNDVFDRYFLPSAVLGNKNACLAVAYRYESIGSFSDADYWYGRAALSGAPSAIRARDEFKKGMDEKL